MNIKEDVIYFLEQTDRLSDYCDDTCWLADQVNVILNDKDDDKLGRIRDLYAERLNIIANFVEESYDVNPTASWIYNLAKEE